MYKIIITEDNSTPDGSNEVYKISFEPHLINIENIIIKSIGVVGTESTKFYLHCNEISNKQINKFILNNNIYKNKSTIIYKSSNIKFKRTWNSRQ